MKVYTHFAALAPAIFAAGFEPVLLEPVDITPGAVCTEIFSDRGSAVLVVAHPAHKLLMFEKANDPQVWELVR